MSTPTSEGLFLTQSEPAREKLIQWLVDNGAQVSDGLEIASSEMGWGVRAKRDLEFDELLLSIPKTSILSARTTSLPLPIDLVSPTPSSDNEWAKTATTNLTVPTLALVLLHEIRLGETGRFWGYVQSLPRNIVGLPLFWAEGSEEKRWLKGTEAGRELRKREREGMGLEDLKRFYETTKHLLPSTTYHRKPSKVEHFLYAYSLISTRAFLVDIYHTLALVPFADILNHSSTSHTSLASDDFVCHICGSLPQCSHDASTSTGVPERLAHVDPISRRGMEVGVDTVDMRVEREVGQGEEVMNTYGEGIGDARLLVEWGFVEGEFTGNGIEWEAEELLGEDSKVKRAWEGVAKRGAIVLDLYPDGEDDGEDGERLIAPPTDSPKGDPDRTILNLNHNGQISLHIWSALYLTSHSLDREIENFESKIINSVIQVETANISPKPTLEPETLMTCRQIVVLLQKRLDGMYRPEMTMEELLDRRDGLGEEKGDERMAMTVAIDERALLMSALEQWEGLLIRVVKL